jgi:beta-xylosidase
VIPVIIDLQVDRRQSASLVSAAFLLARSLAGPVLDKISLRDGNPIYPVIHDTNFPDPMVYLDGTDYYAFATQNDTTKIQVAHAASAGGDWSVVMDGAHGYNALPQTGAWSTGQNVWAPSVFKNINGLYVMYYSASKNTSPGQHCMGVATSSGSIKGPYTPADSALPHCNLTAGGSIDGSVFQDPRDNNQVYLVYKVDGNNVGASTPIMLQKMNDDGLSVDDDIGPQPLITNDAADGPVVEAPNIVYLNNKYVMFFSSNLYNTDLYDVSYAFADSVTGTWTKSKTPLLQTNNPYSELTAPGSASALVKIDDNTSADLYFHANCPVKSGKSSAAKRCMYYITVASTVDDSGVVSIYPGT